MEESTNSAQEMYCNWQRRRAELVSHWGFEPDLAQIVTNNENCGMNDNTLLNIDVWKNLKCKPFISIQSFSSPAAIIFFRHNDVIMEDIAVCRTHKFITKKMRKLPLRQNTFGLVDGYKISTLEIYTTILKDEIDAQIGNYLLSASKQMELTDPQKELFLEDNYIMVSQIGIELLENLGQVDLTPFDDNNTAYDVIGKLKLFTSGKLLDIILAPFAEDYVVVGHRVKDELDGPLFWCPYRLVVSRPSDAFGNQPFASAYGIKYINKGRGNEALKSFKLSKLGPQLQK
jgi:hypothetical protein